MVDGLISDCARMVGEKMKAQKAANTSTSQAWFDISSLKEPFRVEGKKTMGYELVEQLGWTYPDAVFYPTGGGVGLIGMWKAFDEMEQLGWVSGKRPKMYALQSSGCAPIAKAYAEHKPPASSSRTPRPSLLAFVSPSLTPTRSSWTSFANPAARPSLIPMQRF